MRRTAREGWSERDNRAALACDYVKYAGKPATMRIPGSCPESQTLADGTHCGGAATARQSARGSPAASRAAPDRAALSWLMLYNVHSTHTRANRKAQPPTTREPHNQPTGEPPGTHANHKDSGASSQPAGGRGIAPYFPARPSAVCPTVRSPANLPNRTAQPA